jgi:streptogramin lyase
MAETHDGKLWVTNSLSSTLMEFDTHSEEMAFHSIPGDALYPHTIRTAKDQTLWFTINASNQVGHFNPATGLMEVIALPHNGFWRWLTDMLLPTIMHVSSWLERSDLHLTLSTHKFFGRVVHGSAYGIDINPKDGSVWVAQLYDHKIVRIDPETREMTSYTTPHQGPRRPRFDKDGIFWIPSFDEGVLMRFDPETEEFTGYKLPVLASNEYEMPYALNVHPETNEVWLTANTTDRILRFFPETETFMSYPSPTRVSFIRDLVFTKEGKVCNSTSNLPAYAMEDGVDTFICFDPEGGAKDKQILKR